MNSREISLNTAACRLLQNIMPGLDSAVVFQDKVNGSEPKAARPGLTLRSPRPAVRPQQEGLIEKLFGWAHEAERPLCVYAAGLLARAMSNQEVAANYREHNARLVRATRRGRYRGPDRALN